MKYVATVTAIAIGAAAGPLLAGADSAQAGCAFPGKVVNGQVHMMPGFLTAHMAPPPMAAASAEGVTAHTNALAAHNIVGTWMATYTVEGHPFAQAFIQWHDDYTEWENINLPVDGGNICVGSWKPVDDTHVARLHYGWLYTNGNLSGYFIETETNMIRWHNHYSGVNEQKIYDLNGNLQADVTGTSSAVRIAP